MSSLPDEFKNNSQWVLVGPMGPELKDSFLTHSILGVDGGADFVSKMDIWIGDGDSHKIPPKARYHFKHPEDKKHSDLALALELFANQIPLTLHLWGFLGGRRDHELFNLGEALAFLKKNNRCEILFYHLSGQKQFSLFGQGHREINIQGTFSVGSIEEIELQISGNCSYQLAAGSKLGALSSLGLSNKAHGLVQIKSSGPFFIYYPEHS